MFPKHKSQTTKCLTDYQSGPTSRSGYGYLNFFTLLWCSVALALKGLMYETGIIRLIVN